MKKENRGITLIALVITIIILLILAAITINLTIGQRGILNRAQEAGRNYQEAAKKEDEMLNNFLQEADDIIAGMNTPKFTMVDGVPVPNGFEHTEGTKEDGFVIKDISGTETNGNEFVWVPCSEDGKNGSIKYDRYAFSRSGWAYSQTKNESTGEIKRADMLQYSDTEIMSTVEINSVRKYGGFYIGRYETGIVDYDANVKTSNDKKDLVWTGYTGGKAVVQKDKLAWNYVTRDKAKEIAEGMYDSNNAVTSRLCSSYAWDTALKFIETKNAGYATNSSQGNYSSNQLKNTGGSTKVNNIYDMGGNVGEWTTEASNNQDGSYVHRGGDFSRDAATYPAGYRVDVNETVAYINLGFRFTLYVEP